jgi:hypothetical protein
MLLNNSEFGLLTVIVFLGSLPRDSRAPISRILPVTDGDWPCSVISRVPTWRRCVPESDGPRRRWGGNRSLRHALRTRPWLGMPSLPYVK